jgi:hypothetical protein
MRSRSLIWSLVIFPPLTFIYAACISQALDIISRNSFFETMPPGLLPGEKARLNGAE